MNPWLIGLLLGSLSGVVAALCGVGGGIVLVPVFAKILGWDQKSCVAASLMVIFPTVLSSTIANLRNKVINWDVVDWRIIVGTALASTLVAFFAASLLKTLSNDQLRVFFGLVLIVVGVQMTFFTK